MPIGIIGAMDEEVAILKDQIENREEVTIAGCEFYKGTMNNKDVVLLKSGIGKVNAAVGTTLLIQLFSPKCIINTGSAGGFHQDLNVGDVVISSEVRYNDVNVTVFGYEFGQVPRMPAAYIPDEKLVGVAESIAEKFDVKVMKGLVLSGDSFMDNADHVNMLKNRFNDPLCSEMEAGAIAQVCFQFSTPFVIIRSLSDIAGKESGVSFNEFLETAAVNSAQMVTSIIREM